MQTEAESDDSEKAILMGEWDLHKAKAERAYQQLKEDTALSHSRSDLELLTFDLEQSLPTPVLTTNVAFYKRQLWTYNVGIHNGKTGSACMHMFHEGTASRGSHEIGSCLLKHLREMNTDATHLILYSDSCGGQNRNIFIVCLLLHIVCSREFTISLIDQKFMVSGHSYLPNDRDFGSVETARRRTQHLYVPQHWYELVRKARHANPFQVCEMETSDFVSLHGLKAAVVNRKKNVAGQKVEWLNIRWIRVTKDKPLQFSYKYSHNTLKCWKTVSLKRKTKGRPVDMGLVQLPPLYPGPRSGLAIMIVLILFNSIECTN